jgi:hypothetical protein
MSLTKRWAEENGWFEQWQFQDDIEYQEYLKDKHEKDSRSDRQSINIYSAKDEEDSDSSENS